MQTFWNRNNIAPWADHLLPTPTYLAACKAAPLCRPPHEGVVHIRQLPEKNHRQQFRAAAEQYSPHFAVFLPTERGNFAPAAAASDFLPAGTPAQQFELAQRLHTIRQQPCIALLHRFEDVKDIEHYLELIAPFCDRLLLLQPAPEKLLVLQSHLTEMRLP